RLGIMLGAAGDGLGRRRRRRLNGRLRIMFGTAGDGLRRWWRRGHVGGRRRRNDRAAILLHPVDGLDAVDLVHGLGRGGAGFQLFHRGHGLLLHAFYAFDGGRCRTGNWRRLLRGGEAAEAERDGNDPVREWFFHGLLL